MPPRLRKRAKVTYTEDDDTKPAPTKAKAGGSKAKKAKSDGAVARRGDRHIRGKRGGLEDMPGMPLDVLIEIFGFLHPRDLLNLARTTREFRDFLMSRDAISFWKASRKQVEGLPDPPPGVSEPAYANFLFFNYCHGCLKTGSHVMIYWKFLARYCKACKTDCLVSNTYKATGAIMSEFRALVPSERSILNAVTLKDGRHYYLWYQKAEVDQLAEQYNALLKSEPDKRRAFVLERIASVEQRHKMAAALDEWHEGIKKETLAEKDALRDERVDAVLEKLRAEGWGDEVDRMSEQAISRLASLDGVNRPTKLTERSWKSIRDAVFELMEKVRADRLEAEFNHMIKARLPYLKAVLFEYIHSQWLLDRKNVPVTYASVLDCALFPEVRAVLADDSEDVTKESIMAKLTDLIPPLVMKWMEERKNEFRSFVRAGLSGTDAASAPEPLDLALVAFKCHCHSSNGQRIRFPEVLHDRCFRDPTTRPSNDPYERAVAALSVPYHMVPVVERLYQTRDSIVDTRYLLRREVIKACGMDPDTVTIAEMDACDARLRCRLCGTLARQEIHNWRTAQEHGLQRHEGYGMAETDTVRGYWERVPEEYAAQARALEVSIVKQNREKGKYPNENLVCAWCWSSPNNEYEMKAHMAQRHDITQPQLDVDWFLDTQPFSVWMYSPIFADFKSTEKAQVDAGVAFFATF
ncbi:hypothetical protein L226DRAFT_610638 [Lentinus tigrinus ALCF2SS1-7]|uniref:F-box domain-containing protein n=1 Tax=Lentinus tigrinus ALCF2SS1-6 TaxID=1328759 RepID=A0A5C2S2G2_9APHY|nr:hypothetical protein L227DRAFT_530287 [Lentinus tigrinus ALCF2SS1-6]RPD78805.1 hypothetical protein L226DRAFT_610638 [Lentinus tigrinus ALCF2SS1-7]